MSMIKGFEVKARPMDSAPKDGQMLRLLVQFDDHATEDSVGPAWTIGANASDDTDEDDWQFAGWCWSHDHFTAGVGTPVGWLPMHDEDSRQLADQRAELLEALRKAHELIASIGYPADSSGRYHKDGVWTFDEAIPDFTNASAIESAFEVVGTAIANATQQRNATGGEG